MSTKHTPGPWSVSARCNNMIDVYHHNKQPGAITMALCRVQARQSWVSEAEANARLIAAAPELLKELQRLVRLLELPISDGRVSVPGLATLNAAKAAIAKATGSAE